MVAIKFDNNTQRETLRNAFDVSGLPFNTAQDTSNRIIVGRDDDRQEYTLLKDRKIAQAFDCLGDGRTVKYVFVAALPPSAQPTKHDKI